MAIHVPNRSRVKCDIMAEYYCHKCGAKIGKLNNEIVDFNPSGNEYQLDKYYKWLHNDRANDYMTVHIPNRSRIKCDIEAVG